MLAYTPSPLLHLQTASPIKTDKVYIHIAKRQDIWINCHVTTLETRFFTRSCVNTALVRLRNTPSQSTNPQRSARISRGLPATAAAAAAGVAGVAAGVAAAGVVG